MEREIKLSVDFIHNYRFDSILELRVLFYTQFDMSESDRMLSIFLNKKKCSRKNLNCIVNTIETKINKVKNIQKGYVTITEEEILRVKGVNQLYVLLLYKMYSNNFTISKELFYDMFSVDSSDISTTFKRATSKLGINIRYKLLNNKVILYSVGKDLNKTIKDKQTIKGIYLLYKDDKLQYIGK